MNSNEQPIPDWLKDHSRGELRDVHSKGKRRQKNREAARKSKKRQTQWADELHQMLQNLERANSALAKEIAGLKKDHRLYTTVLERHKPLCCFQAANGSSSPGHQPLTSSLPAASSSSNPQSSPGPSSIALQTSASIQSTNHLSFADHPIPPSSTSSCDSSSCSGETVSPLPGSIGVPPETPNHCFDPSFLLCSSLTASMGFSPDGIPLSNSSPTPSTNTSNSPPGSSASLFPPSSSSVHPSVSSPQPVPSKAPQHTPSSTLTNTPQVYPSLGSTSSSLATALTIHGHMNSHLTTSGSTNGLPPLKKVAFLPSSSPVSNQVDCSGVVNVLSERQAPVPSPHFPSVTAFSGLSVCLTAPGIENAAVLDQVSLLNEPPFYHHQPFSMSCSSQLDDLFPLPCPIKPPQSPFPTSVGPKSNLDLITASGLVVKPSFGQQAMDKPTPLLSSLTVPSPLTVPQTTSDMLSDPITGPSFSPWPLLECPSHFSTEDEPSSDPSLSELLESNAWLLDGRPFM